MLGGTLDGLGVDIAFTKVAVVLAVTFVASPFYVRTAIAAFEAVDPDLVSASRTLGAGPGRTFARVALPLAGGGLGAGAALAFARGLGEFGATIMFAGSLQGVTQTLSLAVYQEFDVEVRQRARDRGAPRRRECSHPPHRKAGTRMETLQLDLDHGLRAFRLELALTIGAETVALVGPSGAGKSSVLRAVAGLLRPERGFVAFGRQTWFDRERGIDLPPERRRVGLVFQEYALFPHLDVPAERPFGARDRRAVPELLERLRIGDLADARVTELSGGERQRVALARALAREPDVLLLDEPLSALDAYTRRAVRAELHEFLRELRMPTLLVTHDFEDAATLADRVGVLVDGRVLQLGRPQRAGRGAERSFVASFTGANLLRGIASPGRDGLTEVALDGGGACGRPTRARDAWPSPSTPGTCLCRVTFANDSAVNHVRAPVSSIVSLGNRVRVRVGPAHRRGHRVVDHAARARRGRCRGRLLQGDGHPPPPDRVARWPDASRGDALRCPPDELAALERALEQAGNDARGKLRADPSRRGLGRAALEAVDVRVAAPARYARSPRSTPGATRA